MADDNNPLDDDLLKELGLDPEEMSKPLVRPTSAAAQSTMGAPGGTNPGFPKPTAPQSMPPGARPRPPASAGPAAPLQRPMQAPLKRPTGEHSLPPNAVPAPRPAPAPAPVPEPVRFSDNLKNLADDMPLQVVAVLGKKTMTLKEVVDLKHGEVVDLKKMPNDSIDLVANGKLVARGELVLIDGRVGIQIKQLVGS